MAKEKQRFQKGDVIWSLFAYLSVLVIIPLLKKKKSAFISYHVNQGLVLFVLEFCCCTALALLGLVLRFAAPTVFTLVGTVLGICLLCFLFCHVMGIIHVCCRQKRGVPIFGEIILYRPERKNDVTTE